MDGVIMFKIIKRMLVLTLVAALLYTGSVIYSKYQLRNQVLRLHVVANSNSEEDQAVKLKVRDAIISALEEDLVRVDTKEQAQALISSKLEELEQIANQVLESEGVDERATVSLTHEGFDTRDYETFSLPAGVYDSLRVTIGSGEGENWWCVVFPSLCIPAATEEVEDVAAGAGFSDSVTGAITGKKEYRLRFFLLDCLGRLENFFA
ncbi:MAG: stage II sporulation protein R [Ruminococcaceae bacterium]|nr:stage II sporulation protein R [Oscillospiraceae bacterium]